MYIVKNIYIVEGKGYILVVKNGKENRVMKEVY